MSNMLSGMWIALMVFGALVFFGPSVSPAQAQQGHRTGAIAGTVIDAHGHPVDNALVTLEDQHHHVLASTSSGHHGEFDFHHVRPGHYTVRASKIHVGHGAAGVDVHAGHVANVHIVLQ